LRSAFSGMTALKDIKTSFPNWLDDVIEQWLLKLASQTDMGWPPPDPMNGHRWEMLLTHPITWWKDVTWALELRDCSFDNLSFDARKTMNSLYKALIEGEDNGFGGDNSPARFQRQSGILVKTGNFERPLEPPRRKPCSLQDELKRRWAPRSSIRRAPQSSNDSVIRRPIADEGRVSCRKPALLHHAALATFSGPACSMARM